MTLAGQRLGAYDIMEEIGRGGMAVVYQAYDRAQRRVVALKVLPPYLAHDPDLVRRFVREGQECRTLQHPHIVHTYDAGEVDGVYYLAMEYLPGRSLAEALARQGRPFDLATAVGIASQIASALDYAHQRGVLHRDVKLRNILLDGRGRAVLSDFGIAKVASHSTLTPARALLGTAYAMSPEQARGDSDLDRRSDVYALGVVLYEMLTGQPPFRGEHDAVILHGILYETPRAPRSLNLAIPPAVERVILTALQKDRARRYATAGHLAAALHSAAPTPAVAPIGESPTRVATPARRQTPPPTPRTALPSWVYVVAGGGIVLAALLIVWALARPPVTPALVTAPTATATTQRPSAVNTPTAPTSELSPVADAVPAVAVEAAETASPTATATPSSAAMARSLAQVSAEAAVVESTSTPTPSETSRPTASSTPTPRPATPTLAPPTATPLPPAPMAAPQLQGPSDGETMLERVQFRWVSVPNAAGYQVETRSDRPGQTDWRAWDRLSDRDTTFNLTFVDAPDYFAIPGTNYYWRVTALDAAGRPTYSAERTFVMQRTQPPTPTPRPTDTPVPTPTQPPTEEPPTPQPPTPQPPPEEPTPYWLTPMPVP